MKKIFFYSILGIAFMTHSNECKGQSNTVQDKQLNISILLDLSDRIDSKKYPTTPEHFQRDIENVKAITEYFKQDMKKRTAWKANGKIRIFFSPTPTNPAINSIASQLNIDCSQLQNAGRKNVYDNLTNIFTSNLTEIYKHTIQTSSWKGGDIWHFFKDDVKDFCIEINPNYRNILIILTDGYIYHQQSIYSNGNKYSYLVGKNISKYRVPTWKELIERDNFGLMCERRDLNNLEVLVLEISAENNKNKVDEDILKYTIEKWFKEMNIRKYKVYSTDLPANTKTRIDNFLNN